jgi:hypothetical protein
MSATEFGVKETLFVKIIIIKKKKVLLENKKNKEKIS